MKAEIEIYNLFYDNMEELQTVKHTPSLLEYFLKYNFNTRHPIHFIQFDTKLFVSNNITFSTLHRIFNRN